MGHWRIRMSSADDPTELSDKSTELSVESTELSDKSIETLDESIEPLEKSIELLVESTELLLVGSWATDNEAFLSLHGRATVTHPDDDDDVRTARASARA